MGDVLEALKLYLFWRNRKNRADKSGIIPFRNNLYAPGSVIIRGNSEKSINLR
jgi:hypothetical protein